MQKSSPVAFPCSCAICMVSCRMLYFGGNNSSSLDINKTKRSMTMLLTALQRLIAFLGQCMGQIMIGIDRSWQAHEAHQEYLGVQHSMEQCCFASATQEDVWGFWTSAEQAMRHLSINFDDQGVMGISAPDGSPRWTYSTSFSIGFQDGGRDVDQQPW